MAESLTYETFVENIRRLKSDERRVVAITVKNYRDLHFLQRHNTHRSVFGNTNIFTLFWVSNQPCEFGQWSSIKCARRYVERKENLK